jgi:ABC-2 type transport system ATP-binding protein
MEGIHLQIEGETIAENILKDIVTRGFIRKFALEEPTLNDIFIEKVGGAYE